MELARGRKVEIKNNQIYYVLMKNGEKIYLPVEAVHQAEKNGISWHTIWNRIHNLDHTVDQALTQSFTEKGVDDLIEEATLKRLHDEERERLARIEKRKEAKLREKKPYLFNVPQKHQMGRYAKRLFEHNAMVKIKKDKYGRVQRG